MALLSALALFALIWIIVTLSNSGATAIPPPPVRSRPQPILSSPGETVNFTCTVEGVYDGDGPVYCSERDTEGRKIKIRLSGLAAREIDESCNANQPCPDASGEDAKAELQRLAQGRVLQCRREGKSYERTVASCSNGDDDLSCAMIRSGKALRWPQYDPDGRLLGCASGG